MKPSDAIGKYLQDIARIPLLSAEREIVLGRSIKAWLEETEASPEVEAKGRRAKEKLIAANLRLVVFIAKKYSNRGLELDDLIQEGAMGLNRAVEKFDFTKGYRFTTYAYWWIRQAVTRALHEKSRTVRLPTHAWERIFKLKSARREYMQQHGANPSLKELSEMTEFSVDAIESLMGQFIKTNCASLDQTLGDSEDTELMGVIASAQQGTFDTISQNHIKDLLDDIVETLPEKEATVIRLRYGLADGEKRTLQAIGDVMGVSRERVRQIETRALQKLRRHQGVCELQFVG